MANEVRIEARPWEPQDLIDDLQLMIDEEPDNYLNGNRTTLCMARDYLKKFFAEESLRPKGRWIVEKRRSVSSNPYMDDDYHIRVTCSECGYLIQSEIGSFGYPKLKTTNYCPNCGRKMEG